MPTEQLLIADLGATLLTIVTAGLLVRRRAAFSWSFFVYVLTALTLTLLFVHWPQRFWNFTFYSIKETAYVVLKIFIALEIWQRSFSSFPRARVRVGIIVIGALLMTAAAGLMTPAGLHPFDGLVGILIPRLQAGTLSLYAIVVAGASWYRVPLHPLHRAILLGFATGLAVHAAVLSLVGWRSWNAVVYRGLSVIDQAAFIAMATLWAWAAWRPVRAPSPIISRLQPWAHSW